MSPKSPAVLVPTSPTANCLDAYLKQQAERTARRLPADLAAKESARFDDDVKNVSEMLERWESGKLPEQMCALMLGKVQSGKTKHLLSTMAWAVDHGVDVTAIFTGVTDSLLNQTRERLAKDFGALERPYIKVIKVPTKAKAQFADAKRELLDCIRTRRGRVNPHVVVPMPILVTLKNIARIEALIDLLKAVQKDFDDARALLIDDEADQASPNAMARNRKIAKIYDAIANTRSFAGRHMLLSYTATPQAILLTEKAGRLRPNRCKLVKPGHGYFGIERLFDEGVRAEIASADDWDDQVLVGGGTPDSLRKALAHFAVALWVRQCFPSAFYALRPEGVDWHGRPASVQMLVHQSAIRNDHRALADLVRREVARVVQALTDPSSAVAQQLARSALCPALAAIRERLPAALQNSFPTELDARDLGRMFELLNGQTRIAVVNADGSPQAGGEGFPSTDDDWEPSPGWILVGGNILGRGLTIPQLVSTYFVRAPNVMTFDTVSQQLRFCGYRCEYEHMLHLAIPQQTHDALEYMRDIDQVTWAKATSWDRNDTDLVGQERRIYYASPPGINLEPSRRNVMDPDIHDQRLGHQLFEAERVFSPSHVSANARYLREWVRQHNVFDWRNPDVDPEDGWIFSGDVRPKELRSLLVAWWAHGQERQRLLDVADVFELEMGKLGLAERPIRVAVRGHAVIHALADSQLTREILESDQNLIQRTAEPRSGMSAIESLDEWLELARTAQTHKQFDAMAMSAYIGGGQRKAQRRLQIITTLVVIEPVLAMSDARGALKEPPHAIGLALGLLAPEDYSVRILGHGDAA